MKFKLSLLTTALLASSFSVTAANYGEALQKSIYFYEAQQSGEIPDWNRTEWRGDSAMTDGADNNVDLTGGWYDAGDHVKFGFPMAATATMLAWGVVDYPEAYAGTGQLVHIQNNLRFVADYFVKAHTGTNEFYGQVGSGSADHAWWGSAEVMQMDRPSYKVDASNPGSDLTGETAAALAAISMVFATSDPEYSATLLTHAKQLYSFADTYRGTYSDTITDAATYYNSWSGYHDELVWGAIWLYRATNDDSYLSKAKIAYEDLGFEGQTSYHAYKWGQAWDDKSYGSYILMATLTNEQTYRDDAERWLDYWTTGFNGDQITYTPGGLAFLDTWGAARYASNTSFAALVYSDYLKSMDIEASKATTYHNFAKSQLEYILGENPLGISYQIGYGDYHPTKPHHRTAHGAWSNSMSEPVENRHLLVGALVGGPGSDDSWEDDRSDYIKNEVATDYNAGFTSAVARLWLDYGGSPIAEADFPTPEVRDDELYVQAKINSEGTRYIEISALVHNHSAWYSRVTDELSFRYFVDLSEEFAAGYTLTDIAVTTAYSQGSGISELKSWGDVTDNIYYTEVSFSGINIAPISESDSRKEVQFRLSLPNSSNDPEWDNSSDPSFTGLTDTFSTATKIALYDAGSLVWGEEPSPSCGGTTGINCLPIATSTSASTEYNTALDIELTATDEDGAIASYEIASQPTSGAVTLSGSTALYTPTSGFSGSDSFTFIAVDDSGDSSDAATVTINVAAEVIPSVAITSPSTGEQVTVGETITVALDVENADGANVYLDGSLVASRVGDGSVTISMPIEEASVTITVIATDADGSEIGDATSIILDVVAEVILVPAIEITSPANGTEIEAGASVTIDVTLENAAGANIYLDDQLTDTPTASGSVTLTMPSTTGTATVKVVATDDAGQEVVAADTLSLSIIEKVITPIGEATCDIGSPNVWNSGFVLGDVTLTNSGDQALSSWTVRIDFNEPVSIEKSWNGAATVAADGMSVTVSNMVYNGAVPIGEMTTFGMQGAYSDGFTTPSCSFIE